MDDYPKIKKRITALPGFSFVDPSLKRKLEILQKMEKDLFAENIGLYTCCEKELLEALPGQTAVRKSSCIPNHLLMKIYGGKLSLKKDSGQRIKNGCGCMNSVDIGSYHLHPCYHNCLFCYANPAADFKLYSPQRRCHRPWGSDPKGQRWGNYFLALRELRTPSNLSGRSSQSKAPSGR